MKKLMTTVAAIGVLLVGCEHPPDTPLYDPSATTTTVRYRDLNFEQCWRDRGEPMIHVDSDRAFCDVHDDGMSINRLGKIVAPDYWMESNHMDFDYYEYM